MVFPVVMYGCESWTIKKAEHRRIHAFEPWCWRRLESPLDCKEIKPVNPKGNHSWILIERTDAEAETPILRPPDVKNWLIGKDPDTGKDWRQEEKGMTEDKMVGWHHRLDGYEFEQALGIDEGQGSLVCCTPWGHKKWGLNEQLNWTDSWLKISTVSSLTNCLHRDLSLYLFTIPLHMTFSLTWNLPGSSPGGFGKIKVGTASARVRKQLL